MSWYWRPKTLPNFPASAPSLNLPANQGRACKVDVTLYYRIISASKEVFGALFLLRLADELSIAVSTAPDGGGASTSEDEKLTPIIQEVLVHSCLPPSGCVSVYSMIIFKA